MTNIVEETFSKAVPGYKTAFLIGDGDSPEVFTALSEVNGISSFGATQRTQETTHMLSPGGQVEQLALGLYEGKPFTLAMNFVADDPNQILLYQDRIRNAAKFNYRIRFTDPSKTYVTFSAIVQDYDVNAEVSTKSEASFIFLPSGAYFWDTEL